MNNKMMYRVFGILSFLVALVTYMLTVQPSVPFWDCAEFSAAAIWQQVPHPPGAPLFLLIGKVFDVLIPFGDQGWKINLVSVLSSAFTVWLLYIITVKVLFNFTKLKEENSFGNELSIYGAAFVGASAFVFSDTFWFNAVESEVYALSTLFVALIVYLMMKWNEEADNPGHEKYLLLSAYVIGLSTGVHLLAILTIFSFVLLVYFRKYEFSIKSFIITGAISLVIFAIIYPGVVKWIPSMLAGHFPLKSEAGEPLFDGFFITFLTLLVIGVAIFAVWWAHKNKYPILKLGASAFLLILFGYSTYTQILLRSNANPPMNENEPKTFDDLTKYLGREQYGHSPSWPRRFSLESRYTQNYVKKDQNGEYVYGEWFEPETRAAKRKDGSSSGRPVYEWPQVNLGGELTYLWKYQINHMYMRYFFWNFVGRLSDKQDANAAWFGDLNAEELNYKTGYSDIFPIKFFALPLLVGLMGLIFHFYRDPKMAFLHMLMFLLMGVLAAIAQSQLEPQPRERDYFYTGSFMVFCMWIGMGVYWLIESATKEKFNKAVALGIIAVTLIAVPINMAAGGWRIHSRDGNFLPFDFAYNILQSLEEDAIVFTAGDNDTFSVWYMQDVAGVRRDVRVVNLSLGGTRWYVHQLKNREPWGAKKIPLSFTNESLTVPDDHPDALSYEISEPKQVSIKIRPEIMKQYTDNPALIENGTMSFQFLGDPYGWEEGKYYYHIPHKLVLDILQQVKFERPIYFSTTAGRDAYNYGMKNFLRSEGLTFRVCPIDANKTKTGQYEIDIMDKSLLDIDNTDNYHKEQHFGFKLRNLNTTDVYYDDVHRGYFLSYRPIFMNYAAWLIQMKKDSARTIKILNSMNENIDPDAFPLLLDEEHKVAKLYEMAGALDKAKEYAERCIESYQFLKNSNFFKERLIGEVVQPSLGYAKMVSEMQALTGNYAAAMLTMDELTNNWNTYYSQLNSGGNFADYGKQVLDKYFMRQNLDQQEESIKDFLLNHYYILMSITDLKADEFLSKGDKQGAYDAVSKLLEETKSKAQNDRLLKQLYMESERYMQQKLLELRPADSLVGGNE